MNCAQEWWIKRALALDRIRSDWEGARCRFRFRKLSTRAGTDRMSHQKDMSLIVWPSFWSGPLSHSRHPPRFVHSLETQKHCRRIRPQAFLPPRCFSQVLGCSEVFLREVPLWDWRRQGHTTTGQGLNFVQGEVSWTVPGWRGRACCYTFQDKSYDVFWRNSKTGETNKVEFCILFAMFELAWQCSLLCLVDCQMTFVFSQTHAASVCFHTNRRIGKSQCLSVHFWSSFMIFYVSLLIWFQKSSFHLAQRWNFTRTRCRVAGPKEVSRGMSAAQTDLVSSGTTSCWS